MMKHILNWLGLGFVAASLCGTASAENRYLFIVETSRAMKRNMDATRDCVAALLARGINGQMRTGDTFSVWTYDSELHAGIFPMQRWSPEAQVHLAEITSSFLKQQRCRGKARLTEVLPEMFNVIGNSDIITVLIFSEGSQPMQGTPFDDTINRIFAQHRKELKDANVPFVTVLQARGGKIVNCMIDSAAGPVNISPVPPLTEQEQSAPAIQPQPAQLPPVIPEKLHPVAAITNGIVGGATVANATSATNPPLILDYSATAPLPTGGAHKPDDGRTVVKAEPKPELPLPNATTSEVAPVPHVVANTSEPEKVSKNEPATPPVSPTETGTIPPAKTMGSPAGEISNAAPILPSTPAMPPLPAQSATVVSSEKTAVGRTLFIAVSVLALVAAGLFLLLRRPRAREQTSGSLITESYEQRKK